MTATTSTRPPCDRELDTTPGAKLAARLGATATMVACSGAVISDIAEQVAAADIGGDGDRTLLTLTIGGNDVRSFRGDDWPNILLECITDLSCDDTDRNGIANLDELTDRAHRSLHLDRRRIRRHHDQGARLSAPRCRAASSGATASPA